MRLETRNRSLVGRDLAKHHMYAIAGIPACWRSWDDILSSSCSANFAIRPRAQAALPRIGISERGRASRFDPVRSAAMIASQIDDEWDWKEVVECTKQISTPKRITVLDGLGIDEL